MFCLHFRNHYSFALPVQFYMTSKVFSSVMSLYEIRLDFFNNPLKLCFSEYCLGTKIIVSSHKGAFRNAES